MLIFYSREGWMNFSIYAEIRRGVKISQYGKPNHDKHFFLLAANPKAVKSICVQNKKGIKT